MPTRTKITKTAANEVTVSYDDEFFGPSTEVYWIPMAGGYVRRGAEQSVNDPQVCVHLATRGPTLYAKDGDDLLSLIRAHWHRARRARRGAR